MIRKSNQLIFTGLLVIGLMIGFYALVFAQNYPPPGPPSPGCTWAWQDAHWALINPPPSWGNYRWEQPYWDPDQGIWVAGTWVSDDNAYDEENPDFYRAPNNKAWVFIDAGWFMVTNPPAWPCEWRCGYWDVSHKRWNRGNWYRINNLPGNTWITPHWDSGNNIWVNGMWWPNGKPFSINEYKQNYYGKKFTNQIYQGPVGQRRSPISAPNRTVPNQMAPAPGIERNNSRSEEFTPNQSRPMQPGFSSEPRAPQNQNPIQMGRPSEEQPRMQNNQFRNVPGYKSEPPEQRPNRSERR